MTPAGLNTPAASATRWRRDRWDEPGTIYFWSGHGGEFQAFSNFAPTPFQMPAWYDPSRVVTFATGEHAFQAAKAETVAEHERIRLAATPAEARAAGRKVALPPGWDRRRAHAILDVVRAKFAVPKLRKLLLSTGERIIAEDSPYDALWGCRDRSGGYTGQNLLGRALMRVRDELRQHETSQQGAPSAKTTPEIEDVAARLAAARAEAHARFEMLAADPDNPTLLRVSLHAQMTADQLELDSSPRWLTETIGEPPIDPKLDRQWDTLAHAMLRLRQSNGITSETDSGSDYADAPLRDAIARFRLQVGLEQPQPDQTIARGRGLGD